MFAVVKNYNFIFITILMCAMIIVAESSLSNFVQSSHKNILRLEQLRNEIIYYDEALTMTSRVAALSNDYSLYDRYTNFAIKLEEALIEAELLAPNEMAKAGTKETENANIALVNMEEEAFELIKNNQSQRAIDILFSSDYQAQKSLYAKGMSSLDKSILERIKQLNSEVKNYSFISLGIILATIVFLIIVTILAVRSKKMLAKNQQDLADALKTSQASENAKSSFLAKMSHEIRTPLNGIIGVYQILKKTNLSKKQEDLLDIINKSSNVLLGMLNDVLEFSKSNKDGVIITKEPFYMVDIVNDAIDILNAQATVKNLDILLQRNSTDKIEVFSDKEKIRQVIINLLGNAIKFTESGEIRIILSEIEKEAYVETRLNVSDTGIGISEKQQKNIFLEFVQEDISDRRKYGGTGLGLTISKQIVESLGGQIGVNSEKGKGADFWINLKLPKNN